MHADAPSTSPWSPPSDAEMRAVFSVLRPFEPLARPVFHGFENLPEERPLLFVGNHTIYGILDVPFLYAELYRRAGILLRGLGDHMHFQVPGWRDMISRYGVVHGTRANCARLMEQGECVLVFPGGAREVTRRRGERHTLIWKERIGFAKMALQHRCTIVPFSAVGIDDAFDILIDANDVERTVLGAVRRRLGIREDAIPPIARSFRPERLYFRIGTPVRVDRYEGRTDDEAAWELRREVESEVKAGIDWLLAAREADPHRRRGPRARAG
jgi:1-acyl-sn-glycerol-3-phosphate acyltransferase